MCLVVTSLVVALLSVQSPASAGEGPIHNAHGPNAIAGDYLVRLRAAPELRSHSGLAAAASELTGRVGAKVRHLYSPRLHGFAMDATEEQAKHLAALPGVEFVEQDHYLHEAGVQTQPLPEWGLDRIDQRDGIDGVYHYPESNVHAYVIDSGVRITHEDFGGRASYGTNTVPGEDDTDCTGHGTAVAGILGGKVYGVAKSARLVAVKVLDCHGAGSADQIAQGVEWVTDHAQKPAVANMSIGTGQDSSGILQAAVQDSIASGITYAVAAGNYLDECTDSPANVETAIRVGSMNDADEVSGFNTPGDCIDIYAPGEDIKGPTNTSDTATAVEDGTSFASPNVAGAAALLLGQHPTFTPQQVKDALLGSATMGALTGVPSGVQNRLLYVENAPPDGSGAANGTLNDMFRVYGDQGGHWTGGDETVSVRLPDGRIAWLFSDSYLGQVNSDGSRPAGTPMIHNCIVVQQGSALTTTLTGGTAVAPKSLVGSESDSDPNDAGWWVDEGMVSGGQLLVWYTHYKHGGSGDALDVVQVGTALATFSLPDLALVSLTPVSRSNTVKWGTAMTQDDSYTYLYGVEAADNNKYLHVARVPLGQSLTSNWEYRTDGGWSANESDSVRLMSGVGDGLSVDKVGDRYVMVTQDTNQIFNSQIVAYYAVAPSGPFLGQTRLYKAPEAGAGIITYDARMHEEFNAGGKITISYNVNSLDPAGNLADVHVYRPRFVDVTLPPAPDPTLLPPTPIGLVASPGDQGVDLAWVSAGDGLSYYVYMRDATVGQSQFTRLPSPTTQTRFTAAFLTNGHTYEFRVSSVNDVGESDPSVPVSAVPDVAAPTHAPGNLTATAQTDGTIGLAWEAVPEPNVYYWVYQRDDTAGETEFRKWPLPMSTTTGTATYLTQDHRYSFEVAATNQGGIGPDSNVASATSHMVAPGAPTNLTAAAQSDGTIRLDWTSPGGNVWFWVYQRDVTAGDSGFTKWQLPMTTCCTATATFLTNSHVYEFEVAATNSGGDGPVSNVAQATALYTAPPPPTNLRATPGDGQVTLDWDAPAGAGDVWYWAYWRDVTAGETEFTQSKTPIDGLSFTPTFLADGDTYEFEVTAINQGGESGPSNLVQAKPMPALPGKPTNLTATPQTDGSITLTWTRPNPNVYTWIYWRDVTAGESSFTKGQYPVDGETFNLALLTQDHRYEFEVAATNLAGDGPNSDPVQAVCHYSPPPAPSNLRGTSAGDNSIDLEWDAPGPNLYYWIYWRDVTAGDTDFTKAQYPVDQTSFTMGLLTNEHVYEFKVTGVNSGGEGPASNTIQVAAHGALPNPPGTLSASAGDGHVMLTWQPSTTLNVYYWVYERDTTAGQSWQKMPSPVDATSLDVTFLTNGHTYQFRVTATNTNGDSAPSNTVSAKPLPPVPGAPSNLTASAGNGQVRLNWTASPTPNVLYWVYMRDTTTGGNWTKLPYPVDGTSLDAQYLTNGHTYQFQVAATNLAGDSGKSNTASAKPMPPFPAAPSNLSATAGDGKATLHWTASPTPDVWYWIELRDATLGQSWRRLQYPVQTCCTFTVKLLTDGHTYDFRVRATNLSGDSSPTNTDSAKPMPPWPANPSGLSATAGPTDVYLSWHASPTPNVYYYIYYRDVSTGEGYHHLPYPIADTHFLVDYLTHGDTYSFFVTAVNLAGESGGTNVETVTLAPPDGTSDCASVTSSYRGKADSKNRISYIQQYYVTGKVCGYRAGNTMSIVQQWDTHGHKLNEGIFWYLLIDCTEGYSTWHTTMEYPHGSGNTTGYKVNYAPINPGHYYAVRVWGSGEVQDTGLLLSRFQPYTPPGIIPFDKTSGCF